MENEYKENILKFLTGTLPNEESTTDPQFDNIRSRLNNLTSNIQARYSSTVNFVGFVPSTSSKNQNNDYSVLACRGTLKNMSYETGALVILDKNYNIVEFISRYSDSVIIGAINCINVDEKGNFYIVEQINSPLPLFNFRITLLNNLVLKPVNSSIHRAIRIKTINIPNQYSWDSFLKIFKSDDDNRFFAIANRQNGDGMVGCEASIGYTTTWNYYTTGYSKQSSYASFDNGFNAYWDSNNELHFEIAVSDYGLVMLSKGNDSIMQVTRYSRTETTTQHGNFIFYSNQIGYYGFAIDNDPNVDYYIYKVNLENKQMQLIYSNTGDWASYSAIWLFKNNNSIYFYRLNLIDSENRVFELSFGLIDDIYCYEVELGQFTATIFLNSFCYANVITQFNRNYVYIQNQNTLFSLDFLWNPNDYNGEPYINSASLIPNKIAIQTTGNVEIFNRNLYNLSNYMNWYTASVDIPNNYLNDNYLYKALLYSQNNNLMASQVIRTYKNVYEELIVNFINRFKIIDSDNNYENTTAASQFTNAMLNRQISAYISKYQINYNDETSEIKMIDTNSLIYTGLTTKLKFAIYVNKKIDTIDLISQDETIVYKTIDCSDLELNKYYLIEQDIRID